MRGRDAEAEKSVWGRSEVRDGWWAVQSAVGVGECVSVGGCEWGGFGLSYLTLSDTSPKKEK